MDVMVRRRAIMAHIARLVKKIISSVTGLVSFVTNVVMPTKVVCEFSPVQEGTGDPSPDNVRPISGWTGCNVIDTGYNLLNLGVAEATPGALIDGKRILEPYKYYPGFHGTSINYFSRGYVTDFSVNGQSCSFTLSQYTIGITFLVKGGTRIKGSITGTNVSLGYIHFFDKDWNILGGSWSISNGVNVPANAVYAMARVTSVTFGQPSTVSNYTIAYEAGTVEPQLFVGATLPITFTDPSTGDPLTVYGGTVTLNEDGSADLVVDRAKHIENGSRNPAYFPWKEGDNVVVALFSKTSLPQADYVTVSSTNAKKFLCDQRNSFIGINSNANTFGLTNFSCYRAYGNSFAVGFDPNVVGTTNSSLRAYLADNPISFVYPLRSSITYHFDNIGQLQSFLGTNNIWHDMNGSITAEYYNKQ